jgi:hypothetical protein
MDPKNEVLECLDRLIVSTVASAILQLLVFMIAILMLFTTLEKVL